MDLLPQWSLPQVILTTQEPKESKVTVYFLQKDGHSGAKNGQWKALNGKVPVTEKGLNASYKSASLWRNTPSAGQGALFLGLGQEAWDKDSDILRQVMAVGTQLAKKESVSRLFLALPFEEDHPSSETLFKAIVEGFWLTTYEFRMKGQSTKPEDQESSWPELQILVSANFRKKAQKWLEQTEILVRGVFQARYWGDLPGNILTPESWANSVQDWFKGKKSVTVEIWDKKRIEKEQLGGLIAVNRGSVLEPRLIKVFYQGRKSPQVDVAFVGKGLTFDSGGISLKPANNMEEMKYDMCGGANVLAATWVLAQWGLPVNVLCLVPATENLPSGSAQKPGDVYVSKKGLTVEVQNTDAEGRLILGEALYLASKSKPKALVELSTLTGAIVVALGNIHAGLFTPNDELAQELQQAAQRVGERIWRMPLVKEHRDDMKGSFTDLVNISQNKGAGSATAAAFLQAFVDEDVPFAHFDIAGTAWAVGNRLAYCPSKGASGVLIRTLVDWVKNRNPS